MIGCGELSSENPVYAPAISDHVRSLLVLSDGKGRPEAAASDNRKTAAEIREAENRESEEQEESETG